MYTFLSLCALSLVGASGASCNLDCQKQSSSSTEEDWLSLLQLPIALPKSEHLKKPTQQQLQPATDDIQQDVDTAISEFVAGLTKRAKKPTSKGSQEQDAEDSEEDKKLDELVDKILSNGDSPHDKRNGRSQKLDELVDKLLNDQEQPPAAKPGSEPAAKPAANVTADKSPKAAGNATGAKSPKAVGNATGAGNATGSGNASANASKPANASAKAPPAAGPGYVGQPPWFVRAALHREILRTMAVLHHVNDMQAYYTRRMGFMKAKLAAIDAKYPGLPGSTNNGTGNASSGFKMPGSIPAKWVPQAMHYGYNPFHQDDWKQIVYNNPAWQDIAHSHYSDYNPTWDSIVHNDMWH